MKFNPFNHIFLTERSPFSEIIRHNFEEKLMDTYGVFYGRNLYNGPLRPYLEENVDLDIEENLGIVDYLSLGILILPVLFWQYALEQYIQNPDSLYAKLLFGFSDLLLLQFNVIRTILSVICIIISLPFIALIHGVTSPILQDELESSLNLYVSMHPDEAPHSFVDFKGRKLYTLREALLYFFPDQTPENALKNVFLSDADDTDENLMVDQEGIVCRVEPEDPDVEDTLFTIPAMARFPSEEKQNAAYTSLLYLNFFGITERIEKITRARDLLQQTKNQI